MKEEINLLSPPVKTEREARILGVRVRYVWRRGTAVLIAAVLVMGSSYALFRLNTHLFAVSLLNSEVRDSALQQKASLTNEFLDRFQGVIASDRPWSPAVTDALSALPADIRITTLTGRESDHALIIQGTAGSRSSVIEYQRRLQGLPWAERVEAPLNNFATDGSGSFTFTIFPSTEHPV